jgi:hypothetical protein
VLGSGLLLLLALSTYSLISVAAYLGLGLVVLGLGAKLYVHLMGLLKKPCKDPLAQLEALEVTVTEEQLQAVLGPAVCHLNMAVGTVRGLILVEDYLTSAKFGIVVYTATSLGALMNGLTLVSLAWLGAFFLPCLYAAKQTEVDAALAAAQAHYQALSDKLAGFFPAAAPKQE